MPLVALVLLEFRTQNQHNCNPFRIWTFSSCQVPEFGHFWLDTTGTDSPRPLLCICSLAPVRGCSAVVLARGIAMGGMGTVSILRRIHGPHVRRGSLVAALVFSGFVLVACGDDDDDEDPTQAPAASAGQTTQPAASASPAASPGAGAASPGAGGATPVAGGATPVASPAADEEASPAADDDASPVASPETSPEASPEA